MARSVWLSLAGACRRLLPFHRVSSAAVVAGEEVVVVAVADMAAAVAGADTVVIAT
jgi:hypothetical protein